MPTINLKKPCGCKKKKSITRNKRDFQEIYQDPRWISLRDWKRRENPLCEVCESLGRVKQMDDVHHIRPFWTGKNKDEVESLAFDPDNVMSVCKKCHADIHWKMRGFR